MGTLSIPALPGVPALPISLPPDGTKIEFGIRPEYLRIDPEGHGFGLDLIEKPGGMSWAYRHATTGERLIGAEDGETPLSGDTDVGIRFTPARAVLFDAKTGERLR